MCEVSCALFIPLFWNEKLSLHTTYLYIPLHVDRKYVRMSRYAIQANWHLYMLYGGTYNFPYLLEIRKTGEYPTKLNVVLSINEKYQTLEHVNILLKKGCT